MNFKKNITLKYSGWELNFFDNAKVFRNYQFNFIRKHIKGNVCEVGPGNGIICDKYIHLSKKITLFEKSEKTYPILSEKYKHNKNIRVFNKYFKPSKEKFDSIIYLDVLEHIKNPTKEIKNAIGNLSQKGKLIISVPAYQHLFSQFDKDVGHYRRYTIKSFLMQLNDTKYSNLDYHYIDSCGYFVSLASKLLSKKSYKSNFKLKIFIWNFLVHFSKVLDFFTFYTFGKSLVIIISK